ncbi:hypothetical protein Hamer_G025701 [Homarus americanus]|uniref:Uncharacterized protein n=1 Tax=Homarus americanus TaxID=6706 RepID=A0A8J5N5B1_HOMAM|nr:hypothetical protein Hamer_G025701 [Homarus americanus]
MAVRHISFQTPQHLTPNSLAVLRYFYPSVWSVGQGANVELWPEGSPSAHSLPSGGVILNISPDARVFVMASGTWDDAPKIFILISLLGETHDY